MIFTPQNIELIRQGKKTETRRIWKRNHVKVGKIYQCRISQYKKTPEDSPRIKILEIHKEPLTDLLGNRDALEREGFRYRFPQVYRDFRQQWIKLHGEWNPYQIVTVIRFELVA